MNCGISDIVDGMEKNDVYILGDCHWIFNDHADSRVYLSISKFPEILGVSRCRSRFVSDYLTIILLIRHLDLPSNAPIFFTSYFRQMDIGLEIYETKDLFVRLLTPTFFVIITVLQIHYFHKDFLEVTNIDRIRFVKTIDYNYRLYNNYI